MHRLIPGACVFYLVVIIYWYGIVHPPVKSMDYENYFDTQQTIIGDVVNFPEINEEKIVVHLRLQNHSELIRVRIVRRNNQKNDSAADFLPQYGDRLRVTGVIERPDEFTTDTGKIFPYPEYLAAKNIFAVMRVDMRYEEDTDTGAHGSVVEKIGSGHGNSILSKLFSVRSWVLQSIQKIFSQESGALLAGILIGDKSLMDRDSGDKFALAGLSHMVVLSGYNITLVVAAVIIVMRAISLGYRARRIVALMAVPFFILMTGTGASSVRAGCMSMMGLLLEIDVRPKHSLRVLLYTLTIMTVVSPWSFIADPSLHLSFLAVIGLWYGTPICAAYMKKVYQIPWIGKLLTETVSVQLIVLPYILFMSGSFSMLSLIANLLTVPLVPLVMLTGMVSLVIVNITTWISLGQIGHIILMVVRIPAEILLQWIYYVAQYVAGKDGWIVSGVVLNKWMLIVGYLLAGIGIMWWHWRHPQDMGNT